jgi:hypothetical protein
VVERLKAQGDQPPRPPEQEDGEKREGRTLYGDGNIYILRRAVDDIEFLEAF